MVDRQSEVVGIIRITICKMLLRNDNRVKSCFHPRFQFVLTSIPIIYIINHIFYSY